MEDRLATLERRVVELAGAVERLEGRLARLEAGASPEAAGPERLASPAPKTAPAPGLTVPEVEPEGVASVLSLCGRSFVVLGGAYLVRTVTEGGSLPRLAGVALGIVYALVWVFLADRAGGRRQALGASFHGFMAVLIGYPLVWEATTRLGVLGPAASVGILAAFTAALVAVGWRQDLHALTWGTVLAAAFTSLGLLLATRAAEPYTGLLVAFGAASLWLTYGRRWHGLRWPAALAADAAVLGTTVLAAWKGGPPEAWRGLSAGWAAALAVALFVVYPGSFAARTLARQRSVNVFELVQTALALVIGFGGAVRVAQASDTGEVAIGLVSLLLAACGYGVAFAFVEQRADGASNFLFFTSLALVLALAGSHLLGANHVVALFWAVLGLAATALGARLGRLSLEAHGAVYLWAAALQGGLLGAALDAFGGTAGAAWRPFSATAVTVLAAAGVATVLGALWRTDVAGASRTRRLPGLALALVTVIGLGGGVVATATLLAGAGKDPGIQAAIRTAVLAAGAVSLALLRSRTRLFELAWIATPLLALGAIKLLLVDLTVGRPATLFPAFALYGVALLWVPGLLRHAGTRTKEPASPAV